MQLNKEFTLVILLLFIFITGIRGEDAEAIVPESASHQETAVDSCDEAVGTLPHLLAEVIAQVPSGQVTTLIRDGS